MAKIIKGRHPGKPYTVRYFLEERQRERSFRTMGEAKDFIAEFEHGRREGTYVDARAGRQPFRDYADRWVEMHPCSDTTRRSYRSVIRAHLNPSIGDTAIGKITRERLRDLLLVELPSKPLGAHSVAKCHLVLHAVLGEAARERKIPVSPAHDIRLPAAPRRGEMEIPGPEQIDLLADSMSKWGATIALMAGCGPRLGEALAVRMPDEGATVLRVTEQKRPDGSYGPLKHRKAGEFRDVPLPLWVAERLSSAYSGPSGAYLWPEATDKHFRPVFSAAREAASLPASFTPHSLRHVFASVALANGVPLTDVSRFLGHSSIQVTYGLYSHLVPTSLGEARTVLDKWHG